MSISRCDICYELKAVACSSEVTIEANLSATTTYTVFLEDKFGQFHTQEIETDGSGTLALDITQFDEGMFTQYSGSYELSVSTDESISTYEMLIINGVSYPCVKLSFFKVD